MPEYYLIQQEYCLADHMPVPLPYTYPTQLMVTHTETNTVCSIVSYHSILPQHTMHI